MPCVESCTLLLNNPTFVTLLFLCICLLFAVIEFVVDHFWEIDTNSLLVLNFVLSLLTSYLHYYHIT